MAAKIVMWLIIVLSDDTHGDIWLVHKKVQSDRELP